MTAYTDFLSDPLREDLWLVELEALEVSTGSAVVFRYSSSKFGTEPTDTPASEQYSPRVLEGLSYKSASIPPGTVGLLPEREGGRVLLRQVAGDLDSVFGPDADYAFEGRSCTIRHGGRSRYGKLAYADFGVVYQGEVSAVECGIEAVSIELRAAVERLDFPAETRKLFGGRWCLDLDGSTASVSFGAPAALDVSGAIVVDFWLYLDALPASALLVGWAGTAYPWSIRTDASGKVVFRDSSTVHFTATDALPSAGWAHVAVVVDSGAATLYVYGWRAQAETLETFSGSYGSRPSASAANVYVGGDGSSLWLDGSVREVRVWSGTKTTDEVRELRYRRLSDSELVDPSLLFCARFDDGTGSSVADLSTTAATGTISGSTNWIPSLGGSDDGEGAAVPNVFGRVKGFEPLKVDVAPYWVAQVHAAKIDSIVALYEGLGSDIALDGSPYTDLKTFLLATPPPAKYHVLTCDDGSYVRLGSDPSYPITVEVKGDASGSGYVETAGTIVRRLITTRGPEPYADPGELDTSAFSTFESASPEVVGIVLADGETISSAVSRLLAGANGIAYGSRSESKFRPVRFGGVIGETPVLALTEADVLGGIQSIAGEVPVGRAVIRYAKNHRVHSETEIAQAVADPEHRLFGVREWRSVDLERPSVIERYPRARTIFLETALLERDAALALATELLDLYGQKGRGFKFRARGRAVQLDRLDPVSFVYRLPNEFNVPTARLGTDGAPVFRVLGFSGDGRNRTEELIL